MCEMRARHDQVSLSKLSLLRPYIAVPKRSEMITISNTQYVHFLEQADALRRAGLLCDTVISVRNQVFRAHRLVLACVSRRLAKQLALEEGDGPVRCSLESVSPRTFKQVLDFAYTRELEVTRDDLQPLLKAAEVLEMQPLEEQCRTQLESTRDRSSRGGEEGGKHRKQKLKRGPVEGQKPGETLGEVCGGAVIGDTSPSETPGSPQPSVKKARLPSSPAAPCDRVSVISRHTGSGPSYSSSWAFPSTWKSAGALRRLADYSGFVPFHPLQQADPSAVPYHFSSGAQHVLPLLGSRFQSSAAAFSDLSYARGLYAGSTGTRSRIKQGPAKSKKGQEGTFQTSEQRSVSVLIIHFWNPHTLDLRLKSPLFPISKSYSFIRLPDSSLLGLTCILLHFPSRAVLTVNPSLATQVSQSVLNLTRRSEHKKKNKIIQFV